jgi:hypothetical protein
MDFMEIGFVSMDWIQDAILWTVLCALCKTSRFHKKRQFLDELRNCGRSDTTKFVFC